jgi:hypothetical protein
MARMPGAIWQPYPTPGRARRVKGRCVVFHIAVSESTNLRPWGGPADWHFYVNKAGTIYQFIDTDFQAWAAAEANRTGIMVETQGGVHNPETEPLTAAQIEAWAKIAAWAHESEGIPLRLMQNSLSTERGLGWHKLGVDPWRIAGGQRWSFAYGKICPGLKKISQMPQVLARAMQIAGGDNNEELDVDEATLRRIISEEISKNKRIVHIERIVGDMAVREKADDVNQHAKLDGIAAKLDEPEV